MTTFEEMINAARGAALAGDTEQGLDLIGMLPNNARGREIARAFATGVPIPVFRTMLECAWDHDHYEVCKAAKSERTLKKWFGHAAFDVSYLPDELVLYRGGMCFSLENHIQIPRSLCWGSSWTLDRDAACFFATIYCQRTGHNRIPGAYPCVVKVRAPRHYALAHITTRRESEIVAFTRRLHQRHVIDGDNTTVLQAAGSWRPSDRLVAEWHASGERYLRSAKYLIRRKREADSLAQHIVFRDRYCCATFGGSSAVSDCHRYLELSMVISEQL